MYKMDFFFHFCINIFHFKVNKKMKKLFKNVPKNLNIMNLKIPSHPKNHILVLGVERTNTHHGIFINGKKSKKLQKNKKQN